MSEWVSPLLRWCAVPLHRAYCAPNLHTHSCDFTLPLLGIPHLVLVPSGRTLSSYPRIWACMHLMGIVDSDNRLVIWYGYGHEGLSLEHVTNF